MLGCRTGFTPANQNPISLRPLPAPVRVSDLVFLLGMLASKEVLPVSFYSLQPSLLRNRKHPGLQQRWQAHQLQWGVQRLLWLEAPPRSLRITPQRPRRQVRWQHLLQRPLRVEIQNVGPAFEFAHPLQLRLPRSCLRQLPMQLARPLRMQASC